MYIGFNAAMKIDYQKNFHKYFINKKADSSIFFIRNMIK